jgi:hypothetical protein
MPIEADSDCIEVGRVSEHHGVIGHSKGALGIENAMRSLDPQRLKELMVLTFGCAVAYEQAESRYDKFLGMSTRSASSTLGFTLSSSGF